MDPCTLITEVEQREDDSWRIYGRLTINLLTKPGLAEFIYQTHGNLLEDTTSDPHHIVIRDLKQQLY